jgi:oligoendopeptidase F
MSANPAPQPDHALPRWRLDELYAGPDCPKLKAEMAAADAEIADFAKTYQGKLGALDAAAFAAMLKRFDALQDMTGRVATYSSLLFAQDNSIPAHAKFYSDIGDWLTGLGAQLLFVEIEINKIPQGQIEALSRDAGVAKYRSWLDATRAFAPHQLSDDLEKLSLEKNQTGNMAWTRLFEETYASLTAKVGGEDVSLEQALHRLSDKDRESRRSAAEALATTFKANIRTFSLILNTLAKDKQIDDDWRKFQSPMHARHLSNRVEPEVVDALAASVKRAFPKLSHRYYAMKARWMGLDKLEHWDRNAPLPVAPDRTYSWDQARDTVLSAFGGFSPKVAGIAKTFFDKGWIDAAPARGKSGGAFSAPAAPSQHPFVLMTFLGKGRDVMTLAHELGHGVHQVLAAEQGPLLSQTPLTVAETASVFGEMLTFRKLLADAGPGKLRLALLAQKAEDMLNTVVRQIAFYEFETRFHAARKSGELTPDQIGAIWLDVQRESLGPAFHFAPGYETYWCYIGHFVRSPFYVYAYAFGDCLVNSLYAQFEHSPQGFQDRYLALLSAGGAKPYGELLKPFGLDARDPAFWDRGLDVIAGIIDETERAAKGLVE